MSYQTSPEAHKGEDGDLDSEDVGKEPVAPVSDFRRAFPGESPGEVEALAFLADTDNTSEHQHPFLLGEPRVPEDAAHRDGVVPYVDQDALPLGR